MFQFGLVVAGCAALGQSVIAVASRKLKSVHYTVIQFNYALLSSTIMGSILLGIYL